MTTILLRHRTRRNKSKPHEFYCTILTNWFQISLDTDLKSSSSGTELRQGDGVIYSQIEGPPPPPPIINSNLAYTILVAEQQT